MAKVASNFIVAILICAIFFTPIRTMANDGVGAAIGGLATWASYEMALKSMLKIGNDVNAQMQARKQDIETNGTDKNQRDIQIVNEIMTRLINNADYTLKVNSLPFVWNVNDSERFNAACLPMNYITINRGLLNGMNFDEDQIAAVLAHEMYHGIRQHTAKIYAQAVAYNVGAMAVGVNVDSAYIDWGKVSGMINYSIAKSVISPLENEADEGGFYLMTSAGFNPGGGAAAMARMNYYTRYETKDILEYDARDKPAEQTFSDHPDTENRESKLAQLMTDYSINHVTVKKVERAYKVYIDGKEIYTATNTAGKIDASTKAYNLAGALAKAFHDYNAVDDWNFRRGAGNIMDVLNEDKVYIQARQIVFIANIGDKIHDAVVAAYKKGDSKARKKYFDAEQKRLDDWNKIKTSTLTADIAAAKQLRINADIYNDYNEGNLALIEIARAMAAENQDDIPECLAIRGRAKAILGDFDSALNDVNDAVNGDSENLYNFLNRADVRRMRGEIDLAIADTDNAIKIDGKNPIIYKLRGDIYDGIGDTVNAESNYRTCYELSKKNPHLVPMNYLEKIDAEIADKLKRQQSNDKVNNED